MGIKMAYWIQVTETPTNTSRWLNLEKATSIEIACSQQAGNELFYVKAKVDEGGRESAFTLGKFTTIKEAEKFVRGIITKG
jgi:hypothetical protein